MPNSQVRVFCPVCNDGKNVIWQGSGIDWGMELTKEKPPRWAQYADTHEKIHGHRIMVEYPGGQIIAWRNP